MLFLVPKKNIIYARGPKICYWTYGRAEGAVSSCQWNPLVRILNFILIIVRASKCHHCNSPPSLFLRIFDFFWLGPFLPRRIFIHVLLNPDFSNPRFFELPDNSNQKLFPLLSRTLQFYPRFLELPISWTNLRSPGGSRNRDSTVYH